MKIRVEKLLGFVYFKVLSADTLLLSSLFQAAGVITWPGAPEGPSAGGCHTLRDPRRRLKHTVPFALAVPQR